MLNERGIKGVTPSAINTPAGPNYTPTVTPCNSPGKIRIGRNTKAVTTDTFIPHSPDGSPTRDRSPEPALFSGLFSSGADMLRRKLVGSSNNNSAADNDRPSRMSARNQVLLSRQEKRALRSLRLLEKVESLGLDSVCRPTAVGAAQRGVSPLATNANAAAAATSTTAHAKAVGGSASPGFQGVRQRTASPMTQLTSLKAGGGVGVGCGVGIGSNLYGSGSSDDEQHQQQMTAMRSALSVGECLTNLSDSEGSTTSSTAAPKKTPPPVAAATASNTSSTSSTQKPAARPASMAIGGKHSDDKQTSPTDARLKQMQRQKSRRAMLQNGQRPDLGTVANKQRPDLGRVAANRTAPAADNNNDADAPMTTTVQQQQQQQSIAQSFVGTISSLFFGRKGGLL